MDASVTNNSHAEALKRTGEIAVWIAQIAITEPQSCCENERVELRYRMDALFGHDRALFCCLQASTVALPICLCIRHYHDLGGEHDLRCCS